jgi:hypothetical protein
MNFLIGPIVDKLIERLTPIIIKLLTAMGEKLLEKIAALLPVVLAAFGKQLADKLPNLDLPSLPQLTEQIRADASAMLSADVDIPYISDLGEKLFGFDLTDLLTGKPRP